MSNERYVIRHQDKFNTSQVSFYVSNSDSAKLTSGFSPGDLCWAVDSGVLYIAVNSTTWAPIAVPSGLLSNTWLGDQVYKGSAGFNDLAATYTSFIGNPAMSNFTADHRVHMPDASGYFTLYGRGADPPASGEMGIVNRTAQSAAITAVNLTNATPAGMYCVTYDLEETTTQAGVATVQLQVTATTLNGARTQSSVAVTLITAGATPSDSGRFIVKLASGNITWAVVVSGAIGLGRYAVSIRCEYLG